MISSRVIMKAIIIIRQVHMHIHIHMYTRTYHEIDPEGRLYS